MTLRNFLSFGPTEQIIYFMDNDIVLVLGQNHKEGGSNGSGKTTIFNALVWALYGKTTKGLSADEVVNNITNKDCMVGLTFTIGNAVINVTRERKIGGNKHKHGLILEIGGVNRSLANMGDTQTRIEEMIKISFRSFISSVMFAQDRVFSFTDASTSKRKEIIENVLQVDNLNMYEKMVKNSMSEFRAGYDKGFYEQTGKQELVASLLQNIQDYLSSCKLKSKNISNKIKDINSALIRLQKVNVAAEKNKHKTNEEIQKKIDRYKNEKKSLATSEGIISEQLLLNERHISSYTKDVASFKRELKKEDTKLEKAVNNPDKCPVCKNIIDKDEIDRYISHKRADVHNLNKKINEISRVMVHEEVNKNDLVEKLISVQSKTEINNASLDKLNLEEIELSLQALEHISDQQKEFATQIGTLTKQKQSIIDLKYIDSIKKQINEAKRSVKDFAKILLITQDNIDHYNFWAYAFSKGENTIRSFLIDKIVDFVNSRVKHYLDMFFIEPVDFMLDREMNHIIHKNNNEISLSQLSGGEEQRLNLAIAFALFDLVKINMGNDINIMFLDEILDRNLDDNGITALLKIIEDLKDRGNSIYVISHKDTFKNYFNNSMIIYKDPQGISKVLAA